MKIYVYLSLIILLFTVKYATADLRLKQGVIIVDGVVFESIKPAEAAIKEGSVVYFGPGEYTDGIHIKEDNVVLSGSSGTHFIGAEIQFKGTFVISGNDTRIENIECSQVKGAKNSACIRHQGKNLTVSNVYFHDSHQGILEAPNDGFLKIEYSKFERLGNRGRAHGIYTAGKELIVNHSSFIGIIKQGHAIKSRSFKTSIRNTLVTSELGNDSRLIDVPNGGILLVENCILHQGINTVNRQVIGFGLEKTGRNRTHSVLIQNNIAILERPKGNEFLAFNAELVRTPTVKNNAIIGPSRNMDMWKKENIMFKDREEANLKLTSLPKVSDIESLLLFWQ